MAIEQGASVVHAKDRHLGLGTVVLVQTVAGERIAHVSWPVLAGDTKRHPVSDLEVIRALPDRFGESAASVSSVRAFTLRALGRWFEVRHALAGELSNQPFQMLPHQVLVANRVVKSGPDNRRWLIADDVGLGKTIEAGMIMEVLRKRKLRRFRCLIVTPAGLRAQWQEEMKVRFNRRFRLFEARVVNDLEQEDLLIASIDTLRQDKLRAAIKSAASWDLVVFDEAHHLATTTDVQRYKLARFVLNEAKKAHNVLFLTATPHSGNNTFFYNMIRLLRADLFASQEEVTTAGSRLSQVMVRNRKSDVTDVHGKAIFKGIDNAHIIPIVPKADEVRFHEALLSYVKHGYGVADRMRKQQEGKSGAQAVGFLMSTFKKLASSSRYAIRGALEKRLTALRGETVSTGAAIDDDRYEGEIEEAAVARAIDPPARAAKKVSTPIKNEAAEIERLLGLVDQLGGRDSKLEAFVAQLRKLPSDVKILIFTEYRGTLAALHRAVGEAFGAAQVRQIHGSMDLEQRRAVVNAFNEHGGAPRFVISTEAGGEGLNMQKSCHVVVNYDLPWNPIRLQQRIGRVYRYGQRQRVQVYNFRWDHDSDAFVDARVHDILKAKIEEITARLAQVQNGSPEDLLGEVLGTVVSNMSINDLYEQAITKGEAAAKETISKKAHDLEKILADPRGMLGIFAGLKRFDLSEYQNAAARVTAAQLEHFVRAYLAQTGAQVSEDAEGLLSFKVPAVLKEFADRLPQEDRFEARDPLGETVDRATADKERAQQARDCRLLRFGDLAFEAMVRHVQAGDFSDGAASLRLPAAVLGWEPGEVGVCALFDLRVLRQEGADARILRDELAAYALRRGGPAVRVPDLFDRLHEAQPGPATVDVDELRRAYTEARDAADGALRAMRDEVVHEYGVAAGIVPEIAPYGLAWIEAVAA